MDHPARSRPTRTPPRPPAAAPRCAPTGARRAVPRRARALGAVPADLRAAVAAALALLLAAACAPRAAEEAVPAGPERVEIPGLDLALADLPEPFTVEANQGETFRLAAPGGTLRIEAGPLQRVGINLVEEVRARKAAFESAPGGRYFGNRELMTPNGTAFTARGSYDTEAGTPVEETWVYGLHPGGNRLLTVVYTYPTGESGDRVQHLLAVLGEIEALTVPPAEPAE